MNAENSIANAIYGVILTTFGCWFLLRNKKLGVYSADVQYNLWRLRSDPRIHRVGFIAIGIIFAALGIAFLVWSLLGWIR